MLTILFAAQLKKAYFVITEQEFTQRKAQGFNRIPLMLQAFADLETPLSLYLKLTQNVKNNSTILFFNDAQL